MTHSGTKLLIRKGSSGAGEAAVSAEASQLLGREGIGTVLVHQHRVTDLSHDDHYDEFEG
jgi:hypothetical protein